MTIAILIWVALAVVFTWINEKKVKRQIANNPNPDYSKRERMHIGGMGVDVSVCIIVAGLITALILYIAQIYKSTFIFLS